MIEPGTAVIFIRAHGAIPIKQQPNMPFEQLVFIQKTHNTLVSFITLSDIGDPCYGSPNSQKFIAYLKSAYKKRRVEEEVKFYNFIINQLTPQFVTNPRQKKELLNIIGDSTYPKISPLTNTYLDKIYTKVDNDIVSEGVTFKPETTLEAVLYSNDVRQQVISVCEDLKEEILNNPNGIRRSEIINRCDSIGVRKLYIIDFSCNVFINTLSEPIHPYINEFLINIIKERNLRGGVKTKKRRYNKKRKNRRNKTYKRY